MRNLIAAFALSVLPLAANADGILVDDPFVPLAPPGVMAQAAYFTVSNTGDAPRRLVGVRAEGYAMAHLHLSKEEGGVATMAALGEVRIAPGQSVAFEPGKLHVMLMHPAAKLSERATVTLVLTFADGEEVPIEAEVRRGGHGS